MNPINIKFQTSFPERYFKVHNSEERVGNDRHSQPREPSTAQGGEIRTGWEENSWVSPLREEKN